MKRKAVLVLVVLVPALIASAAFSKLIAPATTGQHAIAWVRVTSLGITVALEGFTLSDVDTGICPDPGQPYFFMGAQEANASARVATVLSAFHGDRQIDIAYTGCAGAPGSQSLINLGEATVY